ncbi:MAG: sodium:solute symporter [Planctomycetaceae bacterium]|nr:sodium:solute symporter [Planctomycetaceae bacterium]
MGSWTDISSYGVLLALVLIIGVSGWLGVVAQRAVSKGSFLKGFFLGNRGLGVWAMALTATVQSGGTFMGVPSLIYSFGFIVALWIGSYMIVPLTGFSFVGKRLAHLSRRTGAVTIPDLFRGRFDSPAVGLICSLMILFFLSFMLMAQFKAGAIVMKLAWPGNAESLTMAEDATITMDSQYYLGLTIFTVVVVGYTLFGGFLASVWTDLFQSVLMAIGVFILLLLSLRAAGGLENATRVAVENTDVGFITGPGYQRDYLPLGLACSYFVVWIWGGVSSPASVLRVMAAKNTATLRRSIVVLSVYNLFIYLPLIAICICARAILPDLAQPDEVIPRMALGMTRDLYAGSFISGLILAAPFGAVMATVSCYLVVISSGIVRDVYQRFFNPEATDYEIRRATYIAMTAVGVVALVANIWPPKFLQALVVFCTSGQTGALFVPIVMACYWRRATKQGVLASMAAGALAVLVLYGLGFAGYTQEIGPNTAFRPYFLLGVEPIVWAILASAAAGIVVSLRTPPPDEELVRRMFDVEAASATAR